MIRKNAMILGVVPLILIELGLLVPHTWSEWLKTVPIIAAVFISGWHFIWHTIWSRLNENVWLYDAWPKLPFDGSTWISLYAVRFEWPWLRWRCQFGLIALSAWALTCGVIDCIKTALGWQAGQIHLEMLYQGPFSLPTMGLLMVSVTWGMRCLERFSFARRVAAVVKWRGIWKLWGMLSLAIQTLGAFSMVFGMIWAFLMIADDWNGWIGWLSLPLLLLAEGLHWFGSWLAVRVLRHGSGDV